MNSWDQELNKTYQALHKELSDNPEAKSALLKSETEWIKFRDLEYKLIDRAYKNAKPETDPGVDVLASKLDVVETRARELQFYRENKVNNPGRSTPIDRKVGACLEAHVDQPGQKLCIGDGIEDWKSDLASQATTLASKFRPASTAAQAQWSKFRDAENAFIASRYHDSETSSQELAAYMSVFRDRAVQLATRNSIRFK